MMNRTKARSTIAGIIGLLAVIGPKVLEMLGTPTNHWGALGVQIFGAIVLACTTGQAIAFLNKFLPDGTAPASSSGSQIRPMPPAGPVAVLVLVLGSLLFASSARADQQFGGCFAGGQLCAGPSVAITVGQFNLATSKFSGGVSPGVGYGVTYRQDQWYATGLAAYLAFTVGGSDPNQAIPSLMLSFANYVRVGAGVSITEQSSGPALTQWRLLFGFGSDFGGTPKQVQDVKDGRIPWPR